MSKLSNIKIKVTPQTPVEEIVKALVKAGYKNADQLTKYPDAVSIYGYDAGHTTKDDSDCSYFEAHNNEERWVVNGEIVGKDYFTQPETKTYNPEIGNFVETPTPFPSRTQHDRRRMFALAEQIAKLLRDQQDVPVEYANELHDLAISVERELEYAEQGEF